MRKSALALLFALAFPAQSSDDAERMKELITFCDFHGDLASAVILFRQEGVGAAEAYLRAASNDSEVLRDLEVFLINKAYMLPTYASEAQRARQASQFRDEEFNRCINKFK